MTFLQKGYEKRKDIVFYNSRNWLNKYCNNQLQSVVGNFMPE